jgi:uncharacterized protein YgiB involved in biofilm formation
LRRSRSIRLTLLAASAMAMQACGSEDVDAVDVVVPDLAACVERFGAEAQAECERNLADGQARHALTAPRFASVEACREATGSACETTPASRPSDKALAAPGLTSVAIPVMAGLLIGRMLENGSGRVTTPLYAGRPPPPCQPGQPTDECTTTTSSSGRSSTTSSGGTRFYYAGGTYAGSAPERRGAAAFAPSTAMATTITAGRVGAASSIARGGFGASARGFSSAS